MRCNAILAALLFRMVVGFPSPETTGKHEKRSADDLLRRVGNAAAEAVGNAAEDLVNNWGSAAVAEYLGKFGYMSKTRSRSNKLSGLIDPKSFERSIKQFQRMAGLRANGKLDTKTISMMAMPRCGVEDTVGAFTMGTNGNVADSKFVSKKMQRRLAKRRKRRKQQKMNGGKSRSKRYNLEGSRWSKTDLKYYVKNYTPDMTKPQVDKSIKRALHIWSNQTKLTFTAADRSDAADLKISFGGSQHGDPYPFDGKGGTLAHAFFPSDGRAHFDEDEKFDYKDGSGVNLFIVAAHEFGHSLGLAHSSVPNSLMAPFYQGYVPNYQLHEDDVAAAQQLYGKKVVQDSKPKPTRPPPTTSPRPGPDTRPPMPEQTDAMNICRKNISFDAAFYDPRREALFAFKGRYYWRIKDNGDWSGYPKKISRYWKNLPGNLNAAAYSRTTKRIYFFKGHRVWRFYGNRLDTGFPRMVSDLGLPKSPNAATQWGKDGNIYYFKKNNFFRFSEYQPYDGVKRYSHARISKHWDGVPDNPDAVIQWKDGQSYFFKGNQFWRYSNSKLKVEGSYPKDLKKYWIPCRGRNSDVPGRSRVHELGDNSRGQGDRGRNSGGRGRDGERGREGERGRDGGRGKDGGRGRDGGRGEGVRGRARQQP